MAPKIIKQGTERAAIAKSLPFFNEISDSERFSEKRLWPDQVTSVAAQKEHIAPEVAAAPVEDPSQIEKEAYENGFQQGEKAGLEMAEKKIEALMRKYAESISEIGELKQSFYGQAEREVVKLAVGVAKKIVHREIQVDRDIIQTLVRVALSHVAEKSAVTVLLNPVDYSYLLEQRTELSQTEGRDISLLADKSVERGGCLIQTECGDIDARIEEKFREVEHAFFEDLK